MTNQLFPFLLAPFETGGSGETQVIEGALALTLDDEGIAFTLADDPIVTITDDTPVVTIEEETITITEDVDNVPTVVIQSDVIDISIE